MIGATTNYADPTESLHNIDYQTLIRLRPLNMLQFMNMNQRYGVPAIIYYGLTEFPSPGCLICTHRPPLGLTPRPPSDK